MKTKTKRKLILAGALVAIALLKFSSASESQASLAMALKLQPNTLCARDERIIFSCQVRKPAKIVSLCASKHLTNEQGYLQYRFGLPGKIELEYPKDRTGTQQKFQYTHYFRAQVDLTEISFNIDGYEYQITDDYNGEEKPAQTIQEVSVRRRAKRRKPAIHAAQNQKLITQTRRLCFRMGSS